MIENLPPGSKLNTPEAQEAIRKIRTGIAKAFWGHVVVDDSEEPNSL